MTLTPLTREKHATLRLRPQSSFLFAGGAAVVSLYGSELARAAQEFPITFTAETEGYFPAALLGVRPGQSLFVGPDGRWLSSYVPALWRRSAFRLAKIEGREDWLLCIDESSDLLSTQDGDALFDDAGAPGPLIAQATQFLGQLEQDRKITLHACAALDRAGLMTPWDLKVEQSDGSIARIGGLFRIDEARIADLSGDMLVELRNAGALAIIYAHLLSLQKLPLLGRLAAERAEYEKRRHAVQQGQVNLDRVFGIVEDDPFLF